MINMSLPYIGRVPHEMAEVKPRVKQIRKIIKSIETNKASSFDGDGPQNCAHILARLYRGFYPIDIFSDDWNASRVYKLERHPDKLTIEKKKLTKQGDSVSNKERKGQSRE